jgi:uncharacterized protein involved in exopolysaccharide biosynthesis
MTQQESLKPSQDGDGELDLFAFVVMLRSRFWRTVACAVLGLVAMATYSLVVKPRYSATASMIIPQQNPSAAGAALQAAGGLDLLGGGNEIYVDILLSQTSLDALIQRFHLMEHYNASDLSLAEQALTGSTKASAEREGLMRVTVQDRDPKLAADLANGYLQELDALNQHLSISAAGQRRRFYEAEMVREKDELANAEVALQETEEKTGVIEPGATAQANLGATEQTRSQIRGLQVQLGSLLQSETAQGPDVVRVKAQIATLEGELHSLQTSGGPDTGTPTVKVPGQTLSYVRRLRDVRFHEGLFDSLQRQYEVAKEQEAKDISMIEVLDPARPAKTKSWPPRTAYTLAGLLVGALLGIVWTALEGLVGAIFANPENRAKYRVILSGRSPRPGMPRP